MRQARASRRGLQRGVHRHSVRSSPQFTNEIQSDSTSRKAGTGVHCFLENAARLCFETTFSACSTLCLIQLAQERTPTGRHGIFKLAPIWKRRTHVIILLITGALVARHMLVTFQRLSTVGLDAIGSICLCGCWIPPAAAGVAIATLTKPAETAEILNSWSTILTGQAKRTSVWGSPVVCTQVIAINTGQTLFPILFPLLGLVMPGTPIFFLPALQNTGYLAPEGMFQYWGWWSVLYAVEVSVYGITLLPFALTAQILVVEVGIFKAFANGIR